MKKRLLAYCLASMVALVSTPISGACDYGWIGRRETISASGSGAIAIREDGTLWSWGGDLCWEPRTDFSSSRIEPVDLYSDVISVTPDSFIDENGTLYVWGGFADYNGWNLPTEVLDHDVVAASYRLAITKDGELWSWEPDWANDYTDNNLYLRNRMGNASVVSSNGGHYAVVQRDGTLWTWGVNTRHELGPGIGGYQPNPCKAMTEVAAVSCGGGFTAAIKTDGTLWTRGDNTYGELGNGKIENSVSTPVKVLDDVIKVSCGSNHIAAIKADGSLWMWGDNSNGQLSKAAGGQWYRENSFLQPYPTKVMENVASVSCDGYCTVALKTDGTLWTWGNSEAAVQAGGGDSRNPQNELIQTTPVKILDDVALPQLSLTEFYDVFEDNYYAQAVQWAVEQQITTGTSSVAFSPNQTCTTAQILSFLWRANESPVVATNNPFTDVNVNNYYYDAVRWAAENELVSGTVLNGDAPCTRADTVTYLWKLAGSPQTELADFDDVPADADYAQAVAWAVKENITTGTGASTFSPNAICTRGEIVTFLYRAFSK